MGEKPKGGEEPPVIPEQGSGKKKDWSRVSRIIAEGKAKEGQDKRGLEEARESLSEKFPGLSIEEERAVYSARVGELEKITEKIKRGEALTKEERDLLEKPETDVVKKGLKE